jgi:hypothetical protein
MSTDHVRDRERVGIDRAPLLLSATLVLAGQVLYILVTQFHAGGPANDHDVIFHTYATSESWKAVHVGQFLAMALVIVGLLAFASALEARAGKAVWAARSGACFGIAALALYAVLQAVDGVGNQEADRAWASAPAGDESARFAAAEAMRWLEWGARSYHDYALGLALLLLAVGALRAAPVPAVIAYVMGLSGVAYLVQGWVVGSEGFSGRHTVLILAAWILSLSCMIPLLVAARRMGSGTRPTG